MGPLIHWLIVVFPNCHKVGRWGTLFSEPNHVQNVGHWTWLDQNDGHLTLGCFLKDRAPGLEAPTQESKWGKILGKNRFNCHPEPFDIGNTSQLICFTLGLTNLGRQLFFLLIRTLTVDHVPTDQGVEFKMLVP